MKKIGITVLGWLCVFAAFGHGIAEASMVYAGTIPATKSSVQSVVHKEKVAPAFVFAKNERVAWVNIGDSNMLLNGYGWDSGIAHALKNSFGLWSTGVQPINGDGRWGAAGYISQQLFGALAHTGATGALDSIMPATNATPFYSFIGNGSSMGNVGMIYNGGSNSNALRYHFTYATEPGWTGSLTPSIRLGVSPYTEYVAGNTISTGSPSRTLVDGYIDLPAHTAPQNTPLNMRLHTNAGTVHGEFFGTTQSVEDTGITRGFSVSLLGSYASHSTQDMLAELQAFGVPALSEYFRQVQAGLGPHKTVIVAINEGLNDRNDHDMSMGPVQNLDSSTAAGFGDNTRGIMNLVASVWTTNGWDLNNLYFIVYPSHPISTPDDTLLVGYRGAANEIAQEYPRTAAISIDKLITSNQMVAHSYYNDNVNDHYHLNQAGYDALGTLVVDVLTSGLTWPVPISGLLF